jgi:hypothetical protein
MDYTKISNFLELFIGDIQEVEPNRKEIVNRRLIMYSERVVIDKTPFNRRGFILLQNSDDNLYTLSLHEEMLSHLERWLPVDYYEISRVFAHLISRKFPQYKINHTYITGCGSVTHSQVIELDLINI